MIDTRDSSLFGTRNPMEGEVRIPSGCAIAGIFHKKGGKIGGDTIIRAMEPMHDRSNGLGGGFAGYGIYPDFADCYAFHMFYDNESARDDCEHYLKRFFDIHSMSVMPTRPMREITDPPIIYHSRMKICRSTCNQDNGIAAPQSPLFHYTQRLSVVLF